MKIAKIFDKRIKNRNLWDEEIKNDYIFFATIEEYFKYLKDNNKRMEFIVKDEYTPGAETENYMDARANANNLHMTYTDSEHPIVIGKDNYMGHYINRKFFEERKEEIIKYAKEDAKKRIANKDFSITIPSFAMDEEILKLLIESNKSIYHLCDMDRDYALSAASIIFIQENFLEFTHHHRFKENEKVSSKYVIPNYTMDDLKERTRINITLPFYDTQKLKYVNEDCMITFSMPIINVKNDEGLYISSIKSIITKLGNHNKKYKISISINNRELLRQSNLLNEMPSNVSLYIEQGYETYDTESYRKEEEIIEGLVSEIREANLSPLEKFLAVYDIAKKFKPYKENEENWKQSRHLKYILEKDNEYIVCVGFAALLGELCNRVGIPNHDLGVSVDVSYDDGFTQTETPLEHVGHARNLIKIDDDKYNIHGYYLSDATWDNEMDKNIYLNSLITFDRKKEAERLELLSDVDLLFDFHDFDDFQTKMDYFIAKKSSFISRNERDEEKATIKRIIYTYETIMKILQNIDYSKYCEFYNEYNDKINVYNISLSELDKIMGEMLTKYAEYIIPLSNKEIPRETIIAAAKHATKTLHHMSDAEIDDWEKKTQSDNDERSKIKFPYHYEPSYQNAYLTDSEENSKTR